MTPKCAVVKPLASVVSSMGLLFSMCANLVVALWARCALPLSGLLLVLKHAIGEEGLQEMPRLADAVVLSPFFFGLFCMEALHSRRRRESADCSWGAPIYHLCL